MATIEQLSDVQKYLLKLTELPKNIQHFNLQNIKQSF